jgi:hypothetical protein
VGDLKRQMGERSLGDSKPEAAASYNLVGGNFSFKAAQQDLRRENRQPASAFPGGGNNKLHTRYSAS